MNTSNSSWRNLLTRVCQDYPKLSFKLHHYNAWSPKDKVLLINRHEPLPERAWSLLHELSHALLSHQTYTTDFDLLTMELEAWKNAQNLAANYHLVIDTDHIEDCLDSYRDWLHKRSTCPACQMRSVQSNSLEYRCFNCNQQWTTSHNRFARPYRLKIKELPVA